MDPSEQILIVVSTTIRPADGRPENPAGISGLTKAPDEYAGECRRAVRPLTVQTKRTGLLVRPAGLHLLHPLVSS